MGEARLKSIVKVVVVAVFSVLVVACGTEATDRPQDCREDEYFDQGRRQCRSCPAVIEPVCRPGCEAAVVLDQRECPQLQCDAVCQGCDEGQVWDEEAEACRSGDDEG